MTKHRLLFFAAMFYTLSVHGPMAVMSIGAGTLFVFWIFTRAKHLKKDLGQFRSSPLLIPTVVFGVACVWSLVWAKMTGLTFMGAEPRISWLQDIRKIWHLAFPFVLAAAFSRLSDIELRKVTRFWFVLGVASALLGIVQHYVPIYHALPLPDPGLKGLYHSTGMTGFHLSFATILGFPTAVCLALVAVLYRRERVTRRVLVATAGALLFFIANLFTYSKISWLAMPLTVLLISMIGFKGWPRYLLIALVVAFGIAWGTSKTARDRFEGTNTIKDRLEVWSANLAMIKEYPVFGVGWHHNSDLSEAYYKQIGKKGFVSHAHNNVIDQWASTGLFGLIGFLWWNAMIFLMSWRIYRYNQALLWRVIGLGFIGGWFCLHLNGMTQSNFWDAKVMHQSGWVAALTLEAYRRYYQLKKPL